MYMKLMHVIFFQQRNSRIRAIQKHKSVEKDTGKTKTAMRILPLHKHRANMSSTLTSFPDIDIETLKMLR